MMSRFNLDIFHISIDLVLSKLYLGRLSMEGQKSDYMQNIFIHVQKMSGSLMGLE